MFCPVLPRFHPLYITFCHFVVRIGRCCLRAFSRPDLVYKSDREESPTTGNKLLICWDRVRQGSKMERTMKALLGNRFAPITFTWGFVEAPFDQFSRSFVDWQESLGKIESHAFRAPLSRSLSSLEPLTTPLDRYLLTETRSRWSAIFSNGLRVNDVHSPVAYLPTVLQCRGLEIRCVPDRSNRAGAKREGFQIYGAVTFSLYGPIKTQWLNTIRYVSVTKDVGGWEFAAEGEVQPYEQTANYMKRRIDSRFTPEMLETYCAALGIELFNPSFYGERSLLVHQLAIRSPGPAMSIEEARSHMHIDGI